MVRNVQHTYHKPKDLSPGMHKNTMMQDTNPQNQVLLHVSTQRTRQTKKIVARAFSNRGFNQGNISPSAAKAAPELIRKVPKKSPTILRWFVIFFIFQFIIVCGESEACHGRFVNPVKDICWSCLFPLSIGPVTVNKGSRQDTKNPKKIPCKCSSPIPRLGIPVGFWEPVRLVDVTRKPFCMVNLGGTSLGGNIVQHGGHGMSGSKEGRTSFYHVHWYIYPVVYWLELIVDFLCLETMSFDVAYMSELDPLWNDDVESFIINPEAALFGNPVAQLSCVADCAAATAGFPLDSLFWCNGCQGSLYPFTGNNSSHIGGVQSSLLMVGRMAAKLHRQGVLWGTIGKEGLCQKYPMPVIKKSQYKTQMTFPIPQTRGTQACNPIGRTDFIWGSGKEFPYKGEDFGYLIWRKRNCCVL